MSASREVYERGKILRILMDSYSTAPSVEFGLLMKTMDNLLSPLSAHDLRERLRYLAGKGYVAVIRNRDLPGFRPDRLPRGADRPDDIVAAKLTARGVDLVEANIPADPGISF